MSCGVIKLELFCVSEKMSKKSEIMHQPRLINATWETTISFKNHSINFNFVCQQSISNSTKLAKLTNFELLDICDKIKKHGQVKRINLSQRTKVFRTRIFKQLLTCLSMPGCDSSLRINKRVTKQKSSLPEVSTISSLLSVIIRQN